jgi:glycosyltransferase involved in cell wall biosynthesis
MRMCSRSRVSTTSRSFAVPIGHAIAARPDAFHGFLRLARTRGFRRAARDSDGCGVETDTESGAREGASESDATRLARKLRRSADDSVRLAREALAPGESTAMRVSVVVPARDEADSIADVVRATAAELERLDLAPFEVIVVDDGSIDGTGAAAAAAGARVVRHPYSIGNGAAVKRGLRSARGTFVVLMDGDGQHRAEHLGAIVGSLAAGGDWDMVVGARDAASQTGFLRALGNRLYCSLASFVAGRPIPDLTSGYRAIRTDVARRFLYLLPNTFSYPSTLTLSLMRAGYAVHHVPIRVTPRTGRSSSKIRLMEDGARFFAIIAKIATFYAPLRVFGPLAAATFVAGVARYLQTYVAARRFTNMSLLLFLASLLFLALGLLSEQIAQLRFLRTDDDR